MSWFVHLIYFLVICWLIYRVEWHKARARILSDNLSRARWLLSKARTVIEGESS